MAGIFPEQSDGGLLPNSADPANPAQAFDPTVPPLSTAARFFGNGCDVRLRPAVLNSLISESLSVIDSVGLAYNPSSLINLRTAIEYVEQRSLPEFAVLTAQGTPANFYRGALSPPLLNGYNNGMTLCVVPTQVNQGSVRIDVGAGWWVPVLRNDYAELEPGDWPANVPQCIGYLDGAFFMLGIAASQVPIVLKGAIYFWVRPDGNDNSGDGLENTPERAFRTIDGAWYAVGSRYSASPGAHIGLLLGVPGDYEGGSLGPYGASVSITGDVGNAAGYRIHAKAYSTNHSSCVFVEGIGQFLLQGVTLVMDVATQTPYGNRGLSVRRTSCAVNNVDIILDVAHPFNSYMLNVEYGSTFVDVAGAIGQPSSILRFVGNGFSVSNVLWFVVASNMNDHALNFFTPPLWHFENIHSRDAGLMLSQFCVLANGTRQWSQLGCTGRQYVVDATSSFFGGGRGLPPGDQPGVVGMFSSFSP